MEKYKNAIILPLKKESEEKKDWGLGGILDSNGNYVKISGIPKLIEGGYFPTESCFEDKTVV